jgi:hypothetical protein
MEHAGGVTVRETYLGGGRRVAEVLGDGPRLAVRIVGDVSIGFYAFLEAGNWESLRDRDARRFAGRMAAAGRTLDLYQGLINSGAVMIHAEAD